MQADYVQIPDSASKALGARRWTKAASAIISAAGLLAPLGGCGPAPPSSAELGRVVFDGEEMPGGHKRFILPEVKGKPAEADHGEAGHDHAGHPPHEDHAPDEESGKSR